MDAMQDRQDLGLDAAAFIQKSENDSLSAREVMEHFRERIEALAHKAGISPLDVFADMIDDANQIMTDELLDEVEAFEDVLRNRADDADDAFSEPRETYERFCDNE